MICTNCYGSKAELLRTAYGDYICDDCWYDYVCSKTGKLEYLIGIINGDYPASDFDADFLGEAAESWRANNNLLDLTPKERFELEEKARELGIL